MLISPIAGITPKERVHFTAIFGASLSLLDAEGNELTDIAQGNLCINSSWPSQIRTVYGDHQRMVDTYFSLEARYFTGDGAKRDEDSYYWVTGRVDDVLNVSGHRIGTAEVECSRNSP